MGAIFKLVDGYLLAKEGVCTPGRPPCLSNAWVRGLISGPWDLVCDAVITFFKILGGGGGYPYNTLK